MNRSRNYSRKRACNALLGALLLGLWAPTGAAACDTVERATLESTCVVTARQGVPGLWFILKTGMDLRKAYRLAPELELQVKDLKALSLKQDTEVIDLREALQLTQESVALVESTVAESDRRAREAVQRADRVEARHDTWKWVWWTAGVATGALVAVLIDRAVVH